MGYGWKGKVWWCQGLSHEEGGGVRWHVHSRVVYLLHSIAQCLHDQAQHRFPMMELPLSLLL